jgi:C-terminal processing protease CtpA/Prc
MIRRTLSLPILALLPTFSVLSAQQPAQPQIAQFELQRAHLIPSAALAQQPPAQQKLSSFDLQRAHEFLRQAYDEVRKNYYDPTFHGVDIDKSYQQYNARLDAAKSINETFRVIAAFMSSLHDSHTFFVPPSRTNPSTPGFAMQMIGDNCFITRVRPKTDADSKLHVGDQVLSLNGFTVTPGDFHDLVYFLQVLSPAPAEMVGLRSPNGQTRVETVNVAIRTGKAVMDLTGGEGVGDFWQLLREDEADEKRSRGRFVESGDTFIWKMPSFEVSPEAIDKTFNKAAKSKNLIVDLRDDSGGYVDTLKEMLSHCFDHEVKLGDRVTRKDTKPEMVKPRGPHFSGNIIVLVDHNSASAAELFARVIQLEHRGKVIGDRTAGAVMEAHEFTESTGTDYKVVYGLSITSANLLMTDGKSLENIGVTPDESVLPTADDLAAGKDPVLAHAAASFGVSLDSTAAGKLFPYEWPPL